MWRRLSFFLRASYAVFSWDLFPSWGFLVQLHSLPVFSAEISQTQAGLAGFPLEGAALGWVVPSMQYNLKEFLQPMWIVLSVLYRASSEEKKKFSKDFWQVDDRILSWGERSLKKTPELELGFFESWLEFWNAVKGDGSRRAYFNNSLPPQTVLNSS